MTDAKQPVPEAPLDALRALAARWRELAPTQINKVGGGVLLFCADELDAALSAPPPPPREQELLGEKGVEAGLREAQEFLIEARHEWLRTDFRPGHEPSISDLPKSLLKASTIARCSNAIHAIDAALAAPRATASRDAEMEDAPIHYSNQEACAWAAGWNACRSAAPSSPEEQLSGVGK